MPRRPPNQNPVPVRVRLSLGLIRLASMMAPPERRKEMRGQWEAELLYGWRRMERGNQGFSRHLMVWSLGAFRHAWYLLRTEYTMDSIWQDIKYGFRSLNRSRGIIAIAILSLGVGIGAITSMFSVVDVFMIKSLPYPEADRLLSMRFTNPEQGDSRLPLSIPDFLDMKEQSETMTLAATVSGVFNLSGDFAAERLLGNYVTPGFFDVLGVHPAQGRGFTSQEGIPGNEQVAVISHELWEGRFGADPELLGSSIILDGVPFTVVGVMPPRFWYVLPGRDVWAPKAISGEEARDDLRLGVLGRLKDGARRDQALEEANRIWARIAEVHPELAAGNAASLRTLHEAVFGEGFRAGSLISMMAVFLVLLIACANVANLLLTHAAGRDREVALRGALGAGRSRIVRQFLTESAMVAGLGGIMGIGLSVFGIRGLISIMPGDFPRVHEMTLSPRVLLFAVAVTMLTGLIFGMAPALQSSKPNLTGSLKEGGRGGSGSRGGRLRKVLVVSEVALALVLLVSSALLVQGFRRVRMGDMGFDRSDVVAMRVLLPLSQYADIDAANGFYLELTSRLEALPGVETVGGTNVLPAQGNATTFYVLGNESYDDPGARKRTSFRYLLPGFFEAMDIPVLMGRGFEEGDRPDGAQVAVINESLARRHWPDGDPLGTIITTGSGPREIVGVVEDTNEPAETAEPMERIYFSALQSHRQFMEWVIEVSVPAASVLESIRGQIRALDPTIPAYDLMTLDALIDQGMGGNLIMAKIMGVVALIALLLALGGVYGVVGYSVSRRTQELGVRMSLGARKADVMKMVVRQGTNLTIIGIVVGLALAMAVTRGLSFFLFGVNPFDPLTFGLTALVLLIAGASATVLPARRALQVDPVEALKAE